ncbi:MAG: hypothetical protein K6B14_09610 [Lachnospiraceae bacterium]|nr:hypothetical protein [Lachnospiraceae bacterium]
MKKRIIAFIMAMVMAVTAAPAGVAFAANNAVVSTNVKAAKNGALKITSVKALDPGKQYNFKYTWSKVDGAKYQYRYKTADSADYSKVKTTKKNSAKISYLSYSDVTFQVRTVKTVDGKKKYGKWVTKELTAKKVDKMLAQALNLKDGYVKNGLIYVGGLYASDKNNSSCDLDIALFAYVSQTSDICYIIQQNGKIINYGYLKTEAQKLSDGTEYTAIKSGSDSSTGKEETYGYVFDDKVEGGAGYVITADGKKVVAKEMDVQAAWDIQSVTE